MELVSILKKGGVACIPTDTLYGVLGQALNQKTVERIYRLKKRNPEKPCIILISALSDLDQFGISLNTKIHNFLHTYWPGQVSVVLPVSDEKAKKQFEYLHRGTDTLAFRLPDKKDLIETLKETGPLIAPSANPEGQKPAETIEQARTYFGDDIDMYLDGGMLLGEPSTLVEIKGGNVTVLRKGVVDVVLP